MPPVSEFRPRYLQHGKGAHRRRRAQPEARSERYACAEDSVAAATHQACRVCINHYSVSTQGWTDAGSGLQVARRCHHAVSQHHVHMRCPAHAQSITAGGRWALTIITLARSVARTSPKIRQTWSQSQSGWCPRDCCCLHPCSTPQARITGGMHGQRHGQNAMRAQRTRLQTPLNAQGRCAAPNAAHAVQDRSGRRALPNSRAQPQCRRTRGVNHRAAQPRLRAAQCTHR